GAHVMEREKRAASGPEPFAVDVGEKALALPRAGLVRQFPRMRRVDALRARGLEDARGTVDADANAPRVVGGKSIANLETAGAGDAHLTGTAVPREQSDPARARKVREQLGGVVGAAPGAEADEHAGMN